MPSSGDAPKQEGWLQWIARTVAIIIPNIWSKSSKQLSSTKDDQADREEPLRKKMKETLDMQGPLHDHSLREIVSSNSATAPATAIGKMEEATAYSRKSPRRIESKRTVTSALTQTETNLARKKITKSRSYVTKKYRLVITDGMKKEKQLRNNSRVQKILEAEEDDQISENLRGNANMRSNSNGSSVEFVIARAKKHSSNDDLSSEVLVKFSDDSHAVWLDSARLNDNLIKAFHARMQWEDELAAFLFQHSKCSQEFEEIYGGRFIEKTHLDRARQLMLEKVREADINDLLTTVNLAPIYVVDWSPNVFDEQNILENSLFEFEFTSFLHPSRRVRKQLSKAHYYMNDDKFRCSSDCGCRDQKVKELCKCSKKDAGWNQSEVECWDDCSCAATCPNRVVQRGRQTPLIMMRHHEKGWTMRAFRDIKRGEFVAEYTGEVLTYAEHLALENNTYSVDLPCCFVDKDKKSNSRMKERTRVREPWMEGYVHRHFINTAKRMGNEGRTFSHSCEPNMEMRMTYIERHGYGYHHIAFYANNDIGRFSELTWNYFGEALVEKQRNNQTFSSPILPKCSCGSKKCVIVPWEGSEVKKRENREDSCSDFTDDDEDDVKLVGRL